MHQHQSDLDSVMQLIDLVEKDYHSSGLPLHVAEPSRSAFRIIDARQFNSLMDEEIQALFSRQHILVTGLPQETFEFDERGMATLAHPSKLLTIQGKLQGSPFAKRH